MMNFINDNLNIALAIIAILAVIIKINAILCFLKLGAESPNPTPRIHNLKELRICELLFAILSSAFIFLAFDLGWLSIIVGATFTFATDILMFGAMFAPIIVYNIFYKLSGQEKKDLEEFEKLYGKDE